MTGNDIFKALGELDSRIVLSAAPEDDVSSKTSHSATFSMLGAIAAAIVILILAVPMLLDMLPSDELVVDNYNEVIDKCDLAVFGTYKGKTEKLSYSEYTFEVTEVLKGETEEKEITVRSEKKSIFSEDEMEKYAQSVNASFEEGEEYFLTLQGSVDEVINFISEQIIAVNDLENAGSVSDYFLDFLEQNGINVEITREEFIEFLVYIFYGNDGVEEESYTQGLTFIIDSTNSYYIVSKYFGEEENVVIPSVYKGLKVKVIDASAFENCETIKTLVIPENIETIDSYAFKNCKNLQNISIPTSLRTIGESVFEGCASLQYYSEKAYNYLGCESNRKIILMSVDRDTMEYIAIDDATKIIYDYAFKELKDLAKVKLPKNLSCICREAFFNVMEFTYAGTIYQWDYIEKHPQWVYKSRYILREVQCIDGDVYL